MQEAVDLQQDRNRDREQSATAERLTSNGPTPTTAAEAPAATAAATAAASTPGATAAPTMPPPQVPEVRLGEPLLGQQGLGGRGAERIEITVAPFTGGPFAVSVGKRDTIEELKKIIAKKLKVLKDRICLLYRER